MAKQYVSVLSGVSLPRGQSLTAALAQGKQLSDLRRAITRSGNLQIPGNAEAVLGSLSDALNPGNWCERRFIACETGAAFPAVKFLGDVDASQPVKASEQNAVVGAIQALQRVKAPWLRGLDCPPPPNLWTAGQAAFGLGGGYNQGPVIGENDAGFSLHCWVQFHAFADGRRDTRTLAHLGYSFQPTNVKNTHQPTAYVPDRLPVTSPTDFPGVLPSSCVMGGLSRFIRARCYGIWASQDPDEFAAAVNCYPNGCGLRFLGQPFPSGVDMSGGLTQTGGAVLFGNSHKKSGDDADPPLLDWNNRLQIFLDESGDVKATFSAVDDSDNHVYAVAYIVLEFGPRFPSIEGLPSSS